MDRKTRAVHELRDTVHAVFEGEQVQDDELDDLPPLQQLVIHYQPIVALRSRRIVGFEALVRWAHPERGLLYPGAFLGRAEATGYIWEIGRVVGMAALRQLCSWQKSFPCEPQLWMSMNLSASGLSRPDTVESIRQGLAESHVEPSDFVLEMTETMLLEDSEANRTRLEELKALGIRLALDDFGTAFSSLSWLQQFPFDYIKIDKSFTAELPNAARTAQLVETLQQLSSMLGLTAIAEGIEREEQAEFLQRAGWELGQGSCSHQHSSLREHPNSSQRNGRKGTSNAEAHETLSTLSGPYGNQRPVSQNSALRPARRR
jgi:EAL domain-containing protein (putative c-di-GMP-specific phosphodiesterase class I)